MNAIELAKSRADCSSECVDALVGFVNETRDVPGDIVECGSYRGGTAIAMAATAPHKMVYAFDVFGGLPYGDEQKGFENFAKNDFEEVQAAVAPFKNLVLVRGKHEDTIPDYAGVSWGDSISLIFLDSDFYSSHKVVLETLYHHVSPGGRIVFHDWYFDGVQQAVREVLGNAPNNYSVPGTNMGVIHKI